MIELSPVDTCRPVTACAGRDGSRLAACYIAILDDFAQIRTIRHVGDSRQRDSYLIKGLGPVIGPKSAARILSDAEFEAEK